MTMSHLYLLCGMDLLAFTSFHLRNFRACYLLIFYLFPLFCNCSKYSHGTFWAYGAMEFMVLKKVLQITTFSATYWISDGCLNPQNTAFIRLEELSREEVNDKWKGCIVFPKDTEQTGWGHRDHSLSCSDDDGAPHWITVDSASSCASHLPLQPVPQNIGWCFVSFPEGCTQLINSM